MFKYVPTWEQIMFAIASLIVIQTVLKEVFGVSMIGKKLYKGAPLFWKWLMRSYNFRLDVTSTLKEIKDELTYDGGASTKDMIKVLVDAEKKKSEILAGLVSEMRIASLRLHINDINSERLVFEMDEFGSCTFINEAFLKKFGYSWNDIKGFNWENIIHDDDREEVTERWNRAIKTMARYSHEQRIKTSDGRLIKVRVIGYPLKVNNILKGFYGTVEEVKDKD